MAYFKLKYQYLPEGTEENDQKRQPRPSHAPRSSSIRTRTNHNTVMCTALPWCAHY